jgi:hypothetical protein
MELHHFHSRSGEVSKFQKTDLVLCQANCNFRTNVAYNNGCEFNVTTSTCSRVVLLAVFSSMLRGENKNAISFADLTHEDGANAQTKDA